METAWYNHWRKPNTEQTHIENTKNIICKNLKDIQTKAISGIVKLFKNRLL